MAAAAIQTVEIPAGAARVLEQAGNWELWEIQPRGAQHHSPGRKPWELDQDLG